MYEPETFVLSTDDRGRPTEAFTPDFLLPDFGVFLEVTTMRPDLATVKRRKIRRLAVLRPDIRVVLVDRRMVAGLIDRFDLAA
jgi:hypothetical protein